VPEFWEEIERPDSARVRWQDLEGRVQERDFEGFAAVVVQHEMDHLDGVVLLDHVSRLKRARYLLSVRKRASRKSAGG
jgi:peptide deformylase